ncbi:hypothetical protein [Dactylosporangium sp. CA-092794]|uniref:hypothetical protein n=1 Tax=Dactylosporangium sp. CA-092794 TaxID=3239929 RepID=UPI003D8FDFFC
MSASSFHVGVYLTGLFLKDPFAAHHNLLIPLCTLIGDRLRVTDEGERALRLWLDSPLSESAQGAVTALLLKEPDSGGELEQTFRALIDSYFVEATPAASGAPTEARRRRQLLESMSLHERTAEFDRSRWSTVVQHFAAFSSDHKRDISLVEAVVVESEDPGAFAALCDDGSSLIVLQSRFQEWLYFQDDLRALARYGEPWTGIPSSKRNARLQAVFLALARSRLFCLRFIKGWGLVIDTDQAFRAERTPASFAVAGDALNFILSHEIAHCVLGHAGHERRLFGLGGPSAATPGSVYAELEADQLAAEVMRKWSRDRAKLLGTHETTDYYMTWMAAVAAAVAIAVYERGTFIRLPDTHPPAEQRLQLISDAFARKWRLTRPLRTATIRLLAEASGLQAVYSAADIDQPLPPSVWQDAMSMPCLSQSERDGLAAAAVADYLLAGAMASPEAFQQDDLPPPVTPFPAGLSRHEFQEYLTDIGVPEPRRHVLFDTRKPLSYMTAVDIISAASGLSAIEPENMRRTIAYFIASRNLSAMSSRDNSDHSRQ